MTNAKYKHNRFTMPFRVASGSKIKSTRASLPFLSSPPTGSARLAAGSRKKAALSAAVGAGRLHGLACKWRPNRTAATCCHPAGPSRVARALSAVTVSLASALKPEAPARETCAAGRRIARHVPSPGHGNPSGARDSSLPPRPTCRACLALLAARCGPRRLHVSFEPHDTWGP